MIDLRGLIANALWIAGLALLLAALSWASWAAGIMGQRFRAMWGRPGVQQAAHVGLALLSAGLAATARTWWEQVLWALLMVAAVLHVGWMLWRSMP